MKTAGGTDWKDEKRSELAQCAAPPLDVSTEQEAADVKDTRSPRQVRKTRTNVRNVFQEKGMKTTVKQENAKQNTLRLGEHPRRSHRDSDVAGPGRGPAAAHPQPQDFFGLREGECDSGATASPVQVQPFQAQPSQTSAAG